MNGRSAPRTPSPLPTPGRISPITRVMEKPEAQLDKAIRMVGANPLP
jgi:hypothetical protein